MQLPLCWLFSHTLFSTSRPPSADPAAKLRCANVNFIIQCRSGYVVLLATPTKAEPLYEVYTLMQDHAANFMIEVILI